MLIAVFIFSFFHTKTSTERFFSSFFPVVLYITHNNLKIKVLDSIPHPLNLNLFGELLTLA